ncbi:hypothetical protein [Promicromonospora aerolata]|uniref:SMODS and SLOG-associating 2TM effector domain-containing protein n=1 Tax=Promicromonospora aerolata TaxID=195749 RepID=A0ABW4UZU9_9MICO
MNRWARARSWLRDRYVHWQRSGANKDLQRLGFEAEVLKDLQVPDLLRLARWITSPQTQLDGMLYFGMSLLLAVVVIDAAPTPYTGGALPVLLGAGLLAFVVTVLSRGLSVWLNRSFDYYYEFGQSGGRIIRALRRTDAGELSRKEKAVRAAHAWSRTGRRGGVMFEQRRERVFALLARSPVDDPAEREICNDVRASMLDAVVGKFDPEKYQVPRRTWHEREHLEFLTARVTLIVTVMGLFALAASWFVR